MLRYLVDKDDNYIVCREEEEIAYMLGEFNVYEISPAEMAQRPLPRQVFTFYSYTTES